MMSLWDALRMNMMISYQELVRTFLRIIAYNEESYKSKIAIDDESPLSIHLDHFKKITSALLKKK